MFDELTMAWLTLLMLNMLLERWAGRGLLLAVRARAVSCSLARHNRLMAAASNCGRRLAMGPGDRGEPGELLGSRSPLGELQSRVTGGGGGEFFHLGDCSPLLYWSGD